MKKLRKQKGITLISLIITIILLILLSAISITSLFGQNGILSKAETAKEKHQKEMAIEILNLKIIDCQTLSYEKNGKLPTLAYLASYLNNDKLTTGEIEYVQSQSKNLASLDESPYLEWDTIYTKLAKYPYEFEINSSFKIAINNEPIESSIPTGYMKIPTETLNIIENGKYNVLNYANVSVNVPNSSDTSDKKYSQQEYDARYLEGFKDGQNSITSSITKTLLWTNSQSNFSNGYGDLVLSSSLENFSHILIRWKISNSDTTIYDDIFKIEPDRTVSNTFAYFGIVAKNNNVNYARPIYMVDNSKLYCAHAMVLKSNQQTGDYLIPIEIYGLNFSY